MLMLCGLAFPAKGTAQAVKVQKVAAQQAKNLQLVRQFQPILNLELAFLRRCCELTDAQRKAISKASDKVLQDIASEQINANNPRMLAQLRGQVIVQNRTNKRTDMNSLIRDGLQEVTKPYLTEEQRAAYRKELQYREEAEKQALVDDVLLQIDQQVRLSDVQFELVKDAFTEQWEAPAAGRFNGGQPFVLPAVPEELVLPYLNEAQKEVWKLCNKTSSYSFVRPNENFFKEEFWAEAKTQDKQAVEAEAKRAAKEALTVAAEHKKAEHKKAEQKKAEKAKDTGLPIPAAAAEEN